MARTKIIAGMAVNLPLALVGSPSVGSISDMVILISSRRIGRLVLESMLVFDSCAGVLRLAWLVCYPAQLRLALAVITRLAMPVTGGCKLAVQHV